MFDILPIDSLASEVADIQSKLSFSGLVQECQTLIKKLELPDITELSKAQLKKNVNKRIEWTSWKKSNSKKNTI